ncbi:MAG: integrase arm-type DNA-binding domain-containing protein [Methylocella sp.]
MKPKTKMMLTDRALRAMKPAPGTRKMIWDSAVPSFGVRVSEHGKLTFSIMRRLRGKLVRRTIGQYPIMSLASAREAALQALRDIERGIDPKQKQAAHLAAEARSRANSFSSIAEEFITRHVAPLRTASAVEAAIRRELIPKWGARPITDISRRDIVHVLREVADSRRPFAAHKLFAHVSTFFNWAISQDIYDLKVSPCAGIKAGEVIGKKKEPRDRVLSEAEVLAVWTAVGSLGYPVAPFVRLLFLSGQRLNEVARMTWAEIDLDAALWTIPPERMKGGAAHEVPLSTAAVDILKGLPRFTEPYVFTTSAGAQPIGGFSKMKRRIDAATKEPIAPWRFHDLRRTMRTGLGGLPVPSIVCELCIGHRQKGMHRVYDLHSYRDEKRRALELWASRVLAIVEPAESNVFSIVARG